MDWKLSEYIYALVISTASCADDCMMIVAATLQQNVAQNIGWWSSIIHFVRDLQKVSLHRTELTRTGKIAVTQLIIQYTYFLITDCMCTLLLCWRSNCSKQIFEKSWWASHAPLWLIGVNCHRLTAGRSQILIDVSCRPPCMWIFIRKGFLITGTRACGEAVGLNCSNGWMKIKDIMKCHWTILFYPEVKCLKLRNIKIVTFSFSTWTGWFHSLVLLGEWVSSLYKFIVWRRQAHSMAEVKMVLLQDEWNQ